MRRVPGPIGTDKNKPEVDAGTNVRTQSFPPGPTGADIWPMRAPLGYEEYLAQLRDGSLWYYKIKLYGKCQMTLPSDRLNSNPGGLVYKHLSFQVVRELPLDEYERQLHKQIREAELMTRAQALGGSDIIFDIILFIVTWGGSSVATRLIGSANLLLNIFTGDSEGPQGAVNEKLIEYLYEVLLCNKIVNVKGHWIIELLANATSKVRSPLPIDPADTPDTPKKRLGLILAFRRQVDEAKFKEQYRDMLKIMEQKGYPLPSIR